MQMRLFFSVVALAVQCVLNAQPVITAADQPIQPSEHLVREGITYSGAVQLALVTDGPDATWSFPLVAFDSLRNVFFIDPVESPCAVDINGANMVRQSYAEPLEHLVVDADGIACVGICTEDNGPRIFATLVRQLVFPCAFGMAWSDTTAWTEPLTGRYGTLVRTDSVDGFGSVQIPWGSTGDLLGIRTWETWTTVQDGDTLVRERWSRRLLKPGYRIPVLEVWMTPNYVPGDSVITWYYAGLRYLGFEQFLGVDAADPIEQVSLSPQPVDDLVQLIGLDVSRALTTTIWDARGRRVTSAPWTGQPLHVSHLAPGIYVLEVDAPVPLRLPFVKR